MFSKRMEERKRLQLENMRKEMQEREELLKEEETRKQTILESIRKKEEMRKQNKVDNYRKRLHEESKKVEDIELKRLEKGEERKRALEEWHKNKIGDDKLGRAMLPYLEVKLKKKKHYKLEPTEGFRHDSSIIIAITDDKNDTNPDII